MRFSVGDTVYVEFKPTYENATHYSWSSFIYGGNSRKTYERYHVTYHFKSEYGFEEAGEAYVLRTTRMMLIEKYHKRFNHNWY